MSTCKKFCDFVEVLECKEIENFLLVPSAIDRALKRKVEDQARRTGSEIEYDMNSAKILDEFSTSKKRYVTSQILAETRSFFRRRSPSLAESSVAEMALWSCHGLVPDT